jgi:putative membrane protein
MDYWSIAGAFSVLAITKRLALLLVAVALYSVLCGALMLWLHIDVPAWWGGVSLINTVILGMLMSFRNRVAYDRWWEARGHWGRLANDTRNLAAKIAAFVPAEAIGNSRVAEALAGFPEALKRHLRDETPHVRDLPGFAQETADPDHVPLYLAQRVFNVVADWKRRSLIDDGVLWVLDQHTRGLLDVCGACEKIRYTPLSQSYKTMLRAGLVLNIIAAPWFTLPEFGFWGVPVFELVCFFLLGVEMIDTAVEEPFGKDRDDLDLDHYCRTIRAGVAASLPLTNKLG